PVDEGPAVAAGAVGRGVVAAAEQQPLVVGAVQVAGGRLVARRRRRGGGGGGCGRAGGLGVGGGRSAGAGSAGRAAWSAWCMTAGTAAPDRARTIIVSPARALWTKGLSARGAAWETSGTRSKS